MYQPAWLEQVLSWNFSGGPMKDVHIPLRQDLIQNAVMHQIDELEERAPSSGALNSLFSSQLNHDLITWPRQYLEAYLDSDESGRVPLSPEQLQDVLEAAFERDEALAVEFLEEMKANNEPQTLPDSSLQVANARPFDPDHPYELLFDQASTEDFRKLSARIHALANHRQVDVERRETTSRLVEHKPGSTAIEVHDKATGTDIRKLLGGPDLPQHVELVLMGLGSEARIDRALNDSGVYRGSVLAETARDIIQRITPQSAVIHHKDDLDTLPRVGDQVRISYSAGLGHVQQVRERTRTRELAR
jgi:hypothetical protein